jgi:hypothetical protein
LRIRAQVKRKKKFNSIPYYNRSGSLYGLPFLLYMTSDITLNCQSRINLTGL